MKISPSTLKIAANVMGYVCAATAGLNVVLFATTREPQWAIWTLVQVGVAALNFNVARRIP